MNYRFFERDLSWLAFNYRVLQEAKDKSLPLYERIKFLSIYSGNLEEFYKVRVAEHRSIIAIDSKEIAEKQVKKAEKILAKIHTEVTRQMEEFNAIFSKILPELESHGIILCNGSGFREFHATFIKQYFNDEILPFLQPVMVKEGEIYSFLRDNRIYIAVCMYKKNDLSRENPQYAAIKIPYSKVPRFIRLPETRDKHYIAFVDDIIKENLKTVFPGYDIAGAYCICVSRDADLMIGDELDGNLVNKIERSLLRRKTGAPSRFLHEKGMPADVVKVIRHAFNIHKTDVVEGGYYLALEDLYTFPNPLSPKLEKQEEQPTQEPHLENETSLFKIIKEQDILLQYPYHPYDYLIRFLLEASYDASVEEIMVTQYRVASNSAVVSSLISAAQNGKKVTVFVELKARFDEESNLHSAAMMEKAGVKIIYSIPNLKVHSKVALVLRKSKNDKQRTSYAYLSTGNFNEKTARTYSDFGLFTANEKIIRDLKTLFSFLNDTDYQPTFSKLLVAQFNLVPEMMRLIDNEIAFAKAGEKAHIIIKMNAIQDPAMIEKLYEASRAGVKVEMIIRGICCLVPDEDFSQNISVTRIVDSYLEHARVWYFHAGGKAAIYMGSADWMKRNLYRRIETVFPVSDKKIKQQIIDYLRLELEDNVKGTSINKHLEDVPKPQKGEAIRSQYAMFDYWRNYYKNITSTQENKKNTEQK